MSYQRRHSQVRPQALGLSWSDVTSALQRGAGLLQQGADIAKAAPGIIDAATGVVQDPYLKEVACNVGRLKALQAGQYPGPPCPPTPQPVDPKKGIGLQYAITPLHMAVYARQNPVVIPLAIGAVLGVPFLLGYMFGKRKK